MKNKTLFFANYIFAYLLYVLSAITCLKGNNSLGIFVLQSALLIRIVVSSYMILGKKRIQDTKFHFQYLLIELLVAIFYLSALNSDRTNKNYKIIIIMIGVCLFLSILYEILSIRRISSKFYIHKINVRNSLSCILVSLLFIILSLPIIKTSYLWDSEIYVRRIVTQTAKYDFTFNGIAYAVRSHFQLGFDFIYILFYNLLGNNGNFIVLGNIILGIITIWIFGKIIFFILPNISAGSLFFSISIFAFSPLFLGTIGGISLDFAMMCFFIWFVYAQMMEYNVLQLFFGLLLCFSKEPGVILGASYIAFFIIVEYVSKLKKSINGKMKFVDLISLLSIKRHLIEIIPFLLFIYFFISKGGSAWTANENINDDYVMNAFGYMGTGYIVEKFKGVFLLNYSWIIWSSIIILIAVVCYKKAALPNLKYILGLSFSFIGFFAFNCYYITYLHPRYIMCIVFIISVLLIYFIHFAFHFDLYRKLTLLIISLLLLVQSFFNSDLVTQSVYKSIPIGRGQLISTRYFDKYLYSDANVYNRQYSYWQYSLIDFLDEVQYTEKDLLIFPDIEYQLKDGMSRYSILGLWKEDTNLFYNPSSKRLDNFYEEGSQKLQTFFYNKESLNDNFLKYRNIYYIDIGILENKEDTTKSFLNKFGYISKKEYKTLSWKINIYTIKK